MRSFRRVLRSCAFMVSNSCCSGFLPARHSRRTLFTAAQVTYKSGQLLDCPLDCRRLEARATPHAKTPCGA